MNWNLGKSPGSGALLLMGLAVVLLLATFFLRLSDRIGTLVLFLGTGSFISGVFLFALAKPEVMEARYAAFLPVQGSLNLCQLYKEAGVMEKAIFVPSQGDASMAMQYVSANPPQPKGDAASPEMQEFLMKPLCAPLLEELRKDSAFRIPNELGDILGLVQEVMTDVLDVADRVTSRREGDTVTVQIRGYSLLRGCRKAQETSPGCCLMNPCPVCSLVPCLISQGLGVQTRLARIDIDPKTSSLVLEITLL